MLLFLVPVVLSGCASCLDCGKIVMDHSITRMFEAITINPEYRYYYSGNDGEPDAIMGIKKEYTVQGGYWHEVDMTESQLRWWVESIETARSLYVEDYQGYEIHAPDGTVSGVYYSRMSWLVVKYPGDNIIYVSQPALPPWKVDENEDYRGYHSLR